MTIPAAVVKMTTGAVFRFALIILFLFLFCGSLTAQSGPEFIQAISEIYTDIKQSDSTEYLGNKVTIGGTATVATGLLHERYLQSYIQDTTAGISIFSEKIDEVFGEGDSLVVTGYLQQYYGLIEIHVESYEVYPDAGREIKPVKLEQAIKTPQAYLGQMVSGKGVIVEKGATHNGKYLRVAKSDSSSNTMMVYVSNFHKRFQEFDFKTPSMGDEIEVTGVINEYDPEFPDNRSFQLFLRTPADFHYIGLPQYYITGIAIALAVIILIAAGWIILLKSRVKAKTQEIQYSLEEKEVLLREIHHRVKNNLAIVAGLIDLQLNSTQNREVQRILQDSRNRIQSMAMIHEKLYNTDSLSKIDLHIYLIELTEAIFNTYDSQQRSIDLSFDMDEVQVPADQAIPCGLLINELVTNAFKHAFTGDLKYTLTVSLKKKNDKVILTVADNGAGLPGKVTSTESDTLGMMLIKTFSDELSAEMVIKNENGAHFSFTFKPEV